MIMYMAHPEMAEKLPGRQPVRFKIYRRQSSNDYPGWMWRGILVFETTSVPPDMHPCQRFHYYPEGEIQCQMPF